ncbi:FUSC family protein [Paenalcaligenes hermetiae]|uniref:FUSC family protein n=1 Tax=Paenalcaligenes hermetiae TaxID=1157987 RepID=A0ABP9LXQ9_9BURK
MMGNIVTSSIWSRVKSDLRPFSGRWEQSWRIALLCALMTLVAMTYQIPEAAISCYVIFFVMKSDAAESTVLALALVVLVSIVILALVGLVNLTIDSPPARLTALVVSSLFFLFLGAASRLGPLGGIIALVIAFVLTLLMYVPVGELATRALLYAWLMVAAPMALVVGFNLLVGRQPKHVLVNELIERLQLAAMALEGQAPTTALRQNLALGVEAQQKRLKWLKAFHLVPTTTYKWLDAAVLQSYRILLAVLALRNQQQTEHNVELAAACRAAAHDLAQGRRPQLWSFTQSYTTNSAAHEIKTALMALASEDKPPVIPEEKRPFFAADALTNPIYQQIAIKATGAAVLCYLIYSAIDWQGIHTAMITCYVAALGSTGETIHKLFLRIVGCLIGALFGAVVLLLFMPYMISVGALMIAVFAVCLLAAWVALGSERISYAGIQIAFAFLLITLQGFGPDIDLSVARDRVVGILLGNVVMYLVFTHIWPQSVMRSVQRRLQVIENKLQTLRQQSTQNKAAAVQCAAGIAQELAWVKYEFGLVLLEPNDLRPAATVIKQTRAQIKQLQQRFEQRGLLTGGSEKLALV